MTEAVEGTLLWEPSEEFKENAKITGYMRWLSEEKGLSFESYEELWEWSVTDLEGFWASIWEYCGLEASKPYGRELLESKMPGTTWFEGADHNYSQHAARRGKGCPDEPAILERCEARARGAMSWR